MSSDQREAKVSIWTRRRLIREATALPAEAWHAASTANGHQFGCDTGKFRFVLEQPSRGQRGVAFVLSGAEHGSRFVINEKTVPALLPMATPLAALYVRLENIEKSREAERQRQAAIARTREAERKKAEAARAEEERRRAEEEQRRLNQPENVLCRKLKGSGQLQWRLEILRADTSEDDQYRRTHPSRRATTRFSDGTTVELEREQWSCFYTTPRMWSETCYTYFARVDGVVVARSDVYFPDRVGEWASRSLTVRPDTGSLWEYANRVFHDLAAPERAKETDRQQKEQQAKSKLASWAANPPAPSARRVFEETPYLGLTTSSADSQRQQLASSIADAATEKLFRAAEFGWLHFVEPVVSADPGAIAWTRPIDRRTLLHVAASGTHLEVVRYLVAQGASITATDREGNRPVDLLPWSMEPSYRECFDLLRPE